MSTLRFIPASHVATSQTAPRPDAADPAASSIAALACQAALDGRTTPSGLESSGVDADTGNPSDDTDRTRLSAVEPSDSAPFSRVYVRDRDRLTPWADPSRAVTAGLAAMYGRTALHQEESSSAIDEGCGLPRQWATCRAQATADGFTIPDGPDFTFCDDGVSGLEDKRAELSRLLLVVRSGDASFSRIYVSDESRITRHVDPRFLQWFVFECRTFGIEVCFATGPRSTSPDGAPTDAVGGWLVSVVMTQFALREERCKMQRRIRVGVRRRITRGFHVGCSHPYGTERWLTNTETRVPVQRLLDVGRTSRAGHAVSLQWTRELLPAITCLFEALAAGTTAEAVARLLDANGFASPSPRHRWSGAAVRRIARNPIYMGDYIHGRTGASAQVVVDAAVASDRDTAPIRVTGFMQDPRITPELFATVQRMLGGVISPRSGSGTCWRRHRLRNAMATARFASCCPTMCLSSSETISCGVIDDMGRMGGRRRGAESKAIPPGRRLYRAPRGRPMAARRRIAYHAGTCSDPPPRSRRPPAGSCPSRWSRSSPHASLRADPMRRRPGNPRPCRASRRCCRRPTAAQARVRPSWWSAATTWSRSSRSMA